MTTYALPLVDPRREGLPLAGGPLTVSAVELLRRDGAGMRGERRPLASLDPELVERLTRPRPPPFDRPTLVGIVNVTPDSFSDGGAHDGPDAAVAHALRLAEEGAAVLEVGGESTRPGARPVSVDEELRRVLPVVGALAGLGLAVAIDTRKARVMREAVAAGARIVNDVSGFTHDPEALAAVAGLGVPIVLMHMRGEPRTMNTAPRYEHPALEVFDELAGRIAACERAGVDRGRITIDPGLCFGKREPHNLDVLRRLALFHGLGTPIMLGASRKGWTARIQEAHRPTERLPASLAACGWALGRGVQVYRVHDVAAHRQFLDAWEALGAPGEG